MCWTIKQTHKKAWITLELKKKHPFKQLHSNSLTTSPASSHHARDYFAWDLEISACVCIICKLQTNREIWLTGVIICFLKWGRGERMKKEKKRKRKESWCHGPTGSGWSFLKRYREFREDWFQIICWLFGVFVVLYSRVIVNWFDKWAYFSFIWKVKSSRLKKSL